jgi:hypothetical protein
MNRIRVLSRSLHSIGYEDGILEIQFHKSGVYRYSGVPNVLCQGLMAAVSKGQYFSRHIKDRFPCQKINP